MTAILGKKVGMTQVFDASGEQIPVTVISVGPCVVTQRKRSATDGYDAIQVGYEDQKEQRLSKAERGHLKKNSVAAKRVLRELPVDAGSDVKEGDVLTALLFEGVEYIDVSGVTKGRGFQGVVKRHGMAGGPAAHGSGTHRRPGSIGMRTKPGRVFKNKRLPGQMGNVQVTTQNLKVIQVRGDDNALLVRGSVPGPNGRMVVVRKAIKKAAKTS
ncbi:MAG TPA: 50S ribosomal protein L3 [Kiritimatiellia bacterium]|nr:50S ribosomal protein L3 [Kiritimatiellia bacterium]